MVTILSTSSPPHGVGMWCHTKVWDHRRQQGWRIQHENDKWRQTSLHNNKVLPNWRCWMRQEMLAMKAFPLERRETPGRSDTPRGESRMGPLMGGWRPTLYKTHCIHHRPYHDRGRPQHCPRQKDELPCVCEGLKQDATGGKWPCVRNNRLDIYIQCRL